MNRYEYEVFNLLTYEIMTKLNNLGRQGWHVFKMKFDKRNESVAVYAARKLEEEKAISSDEAACPTCSRYYEGS